LQETAHAEYPGKTRRDRCRCQHPFTENKETKLAIQLSLKVNGKPVQAEVDPRMLLVDFIRVHLRLTGTHVGCDTSQCGACTVHSNGMAVKACSALAAQFQGAEITTIEGIGAADGTLHPMQEAFRTCHGLQCGFCTPGMVMNAIDLVKRSPDADEKTIRKHLDGNICRCTGYHNIVKAVQAGAANMQGG
jgi:aerobic carbon-monoxide dehydrogenase small subunit